VALDAALRASGTLRRLDAVAEATPAREVLVASAHGPDRAQLDAALGELGRSRHNVHVETAGSDQTLRKGSDPYSRVGLGKFQNLNNLLAGVTPTDWLLVVDDDVVLPPRFLDRFIALCERFELDLAQPAQTLASHAAWRFARRRPFSVLRETNFVEIGPVTAFSRRAAAELLPFPDLRFGWGLDAHWAAVGAERGWRLGIADAVPVRHETRPVAAGYEAGDAIEEAQRFLAGRPYVPAGEAGRTLRMHRRLAS
jgi:hypothetical protein